ncbi:MAG: hypothetical protein DCC75_08925 [Proteobacteria bacterium]|nr:MAG: hypothetical protein DCC75_08925 [Pseudomonadota bacterium]
MVSILMTVWRRLRNSKQASLNLEAILVLPVFALIVFATIDLSRYFFTSHHLTFIAKDLADFFSKSQIEVDLTERNCPLPSSINSPCSSGSPVSPSPCSLYRQRIEQALQRAEQELYTVIKPSNSESGSRLIRFRHYNPDSYVCNSSLGLFGIGAEVGPFQRDIGFQRPGERLIEINADGSFGRIVEHPTRPCTDTQDHQGKCGVSYSQGERPRLGRSVSRGQLVANTEGTPFSYQGSGPFRRSDSLFPGYQNGCNTDFVSLHRQVWNRAAGGTAASANADPHSDHSPLRGA